ncbi:hypothetical protein ANN_00217 [Periplaneta americana]|uniref:Uncharacterized protein n=1 Tax=Periplaneta americana TaxID=6978 RepID=A0ABQ8TQ58_PERAM|nr:hypothetical protein ANN_00217 [Periplaneta americana]
MSPGSSTENYPAFAHIGLRENPGKNLNQDGKQQDELENTTAVSEGDLRTDLGALLLKKRSEENKRIKQTLDKCIRDRDELTMIIAILQRGMRNLRAHDDTVAALRKCSEERKKTSSRAEASWSKASRLGLALQNARWFESSWGKKFSHEISASVWDRCPPSIVMHLGSYNRYSGTILKDLPDQWRMLWAIKTTTEVDVQIKNRFSAGQERITAIPEMDEQDCYEEVKDFNGDVMRDHKKDSKYNGMNYYSDNDKQQDKSHDKDHNTISTTVIMSTTTNNMAKIHDHTLDITARRHHSKDNNYTRDNGMDDDYTIITTTR